MNRQYIEKIFRYFKSKKLRFGSDYVMGSCPFAKAYHKNGVDRNPSFSISLTNPSVYHCFSCGVKGRLMSLPHNLEMVYNRSFDKLRKFINKYENVELINPVNETKSNLILDDYAIDVFPNITHDWKHIKFNILNKYNVKEYNNMIILPFYGKDNLLYGIKYRADRLFYTEGHFKEAGIFYGMQFYDLEDILYIVEGERDVMLMNQFGINNVWGVSGEPSKSQIETLKKLPNALVLFFDDDESGRNFFNKVVREVIKVVDVYYVRDYFGCKDPAELYEKGLLDKALQSISLWYEPIKIFT